MDDDVKFLLGQLVKGQEATNQRIDEMSQTQRELAEAQRQQAASMEDFIQDNARQHAESAKMQAVQAEKLGALVEDLSEVKGEVRTLKEKVNNPTARGGSSEGRDLASRIAKWGEALKSWGVTPGRVLAFIIALLTGSLTIPGIVKWAQAFAQATALKGGAPTP